LGFSVGLIKPTPVTLLLGRARLVTRPLSTGSKALTKIIGIVDVAALAAGVAMLLAIIAATRLWTRSAARAGSRSRAFSAQRNSIATSCPSTKPASFKPWRNAATWSDDAAEALASRYPTTGIAGCCALAASGHAAAPPKRAMNSRRRIGIPRFRTMHLGLNAVYYN